VAGPGCQRQDGDENGGDEPSGDRLEDPGNREPGGVPAGQSSGKLDDDGHDKHGPGDPNHHGESVDKGLIGDALLVQGVAYLSRGGQVVWEGPADEMPQRPGDPNHEAGEETKGADTLEQPTEARHPAAPFCSAVAVPVPVTVRWLIPAMLNICIGWVIETVTVTWSPFTSTVPVWPAAAR
jgi:hypothetical protein